MLPTSTCARRCCDGGCPRPRRQVLVRVGVALLKLAEPELLASSDFIALSGKLQQLGRGMWSADTLLNVAYKQLSTTPASRRALASLTYPTGGSKACRAANALLPPRCRRAAAALLPLRCRRAAAALLLLCCYATAQPQLSPAAAASAAPPLLLLRQSALRSPPLARAG